VLRRPGYGLASFRTLLSFDTKSGRDRLPIALLAGPVPARMIRTGQAGNAVGEAPIRGQMEQSRQCVGHPR
jgi:hypothetical protein